MKKSLSEETEVVKQLDAERRAFKEVPTGRRAASPPINTKSSFVFQPMDEYPTSSAGSMDDPDVWRPPSRDSSRRAGRAGPPGTRKSPQEGSWGSRGGSTRVPPSARGGAKSGVSSKVNSGVRASSTGKKSSGYGKSNKGDSAVSLTIRVFPFCLSLIFICWFSSLEFFFVIWIFSEW